MKPTRTVLASAAGLGLLSLAAIYVYAGQHPTAPPRAAGAATALGNGSAASYAEFEPNGAPKAIGLVFTGGALTGLPQKPTDAHRCLDANGDGQIDETSECSGWHERVLPLPSELTRRADMPFKWVLLNWNPNGHIPHGIYDSAHFDIHFYIEPIEKIFAIQRGTCGPEHVRCDQFEIAKRPVPANYMHRDYKDVDAVAPAMGNHLIDVTSHEFHGQEFDHTFIYGAYDGRVTFYETMLTLKFLKTQPALCTAIKQVPAVAVGGYYPTMRCYRYARERDEYAVSLEDFRLRPASPPALTPVVDAGSVSVARNEAAHPAHHRH